MATAVISRWARRFLLVGIGFLVAALAAGLAGAPLRAEVALGLQGFVLGVVFGKAYSLIPSYFDRTLAVPHAPAVHLPVHVVGVLAIAASAVAGTPDGLGTLGAGLWTAGTLIFVGAIGATIASNPLGRETGTSEANVERAWLDRLANPFMPVAVLYLLAGSYELLAAFVGLPALLDGTLVRVSHLLAAGFALLLLFSVGYRLLPRFLVAYPPRALAVLTLPAGAIGPVLLAVGYPSGRVFVAGAALESLAVAAFAVSYVWLFVSTDRDRIGFYGPLCGVAAGLLGVGLGLQFALVGFDAELAVVHFRLNVFGLLGLSIVGVLYQFYPPAVSAWPGAGDRLALASIGVYALGLGLWALGAVVGEALVPVGGLTVGLAAVAVGYCLAGTIHTRTARR